MPCDVPWYIVLDLDPLSLEVQGKVSHDVLLNVCALQLLEKRKAPKSRAFTRLHHMDTVPVFDIIDI